MLSRWPVFFAGEEAGIISAAAGAVKYRAGWWRRLREAIELSSVTPAGI